MSIKELTEAEKLLEELRIIPKVIKELEHDIEATRSTLITSQQLSDMKVQGGVKKSQEDKNIAVIDTCSYQWEEIEKLKVRRQEILNLVMRVSDINERHVLLTTYLNCESNDEAMSRLEIGSRNKYYMFLRRGTESLKMILNDTKTY